MGIDPGIETADARGAGAHPDRRTTPADADRAARRSRGLTVVGSVVVVLLALLGIAQTPAGAEWTRALGLTPPPQPYTEIFLDPTAPLPPLLPLGSTLPVPVTFTLGNGGQEAATYRWSITETTSRGDQVLTGGVMDVDAGARRARTVTVPVACTDPEVLIAVGVDGTPRPVTHHIACVAPRTPTRTSR